MPTYTLIEYMPVALRSSHLSAGNSGRYPENGAVRAYLEGDVPPHYLHPRWASIIEDNLRREDIPADEWIRTLDDHPEALAPYQDPDDRDE